MSSELEAVETERMNEATGEIEEAKTHGMFALQSLSTDEIGKKFDTYTERRGKLLEKLRSMLVLGTDFYHFCYRTTKAGKAQGLCARATNAEAKCDCFPPGKESLAKAGAEKICAVFQWTPRFEQHRDGEYLFFTCFLHAVDGSVIAEGQGAANIKGEDNINKAVKMGKKRAFVDATVACGGLSEIFTQDMEDTPGIVHSPELEKEIADIKAEADEIDWGGGAVADGESEPESDDVAEGNKLGAIKLYFGHGRKDNGGKCIPTMLSEFSRGEMRKIGWYYGSPQSTYDPTSGDAKWHAKNRKTQADILRYCELLKIEWQEVK